MVNNRAGAGNKVGVGVEPITALVGCPVGEGCFVGRVSVEEADF
jgi:hypothetical protein